MTALNSNTDMYADDTTVSYSSKTIGTVASSLQTDLNNIDKWCSLNNMAINPTKTTCMLIGKKCKNLNLNLQIGSTDINQVQSQKVLGITIDDTLTWNIQINTIYKKSKINN